MKTMARINQLLDAELIRGWEDDERAECRALILELEETANGGGNAETLAYETLAMLEREAWERYMNAKSGARLAFARREWRRLNQLILTIDQEERAASGEEEPRWDDAEPAVGSDPRWAGNPAVKSYA